MTLVEHRLRRQPAALDGAEGAEVTAAAVQGVDGLAAYFGGYLPQAVLACLVPLTVLAWVAAIDLTSALVMLVTLPLVPVFMWLVGRMAEDRARERWQAWDDCPCSSWTWCADCPRCARSTARGTAPGWPR